MQMLHKNHQTYNTGFSPSTKRMSCPYWDRERTIGSTSCKNSRSIEESSRSPQQAARPISLDLRRLEDPDFGGTESPSAKQEDTTSSKH